MGAATVVQQLCKSCRTYFKFYCMFYYTCDCSFTSRTVVQLALPRGIPARKEVSLAGKITSHHDRVAGTTDPRVGDVCQVSTAER